jgi:hypothetical protein
MDTKAVAANHADYYATTISGLLTKPAARIAAAIDWTGAYCRDVLPGLLIDRRDPVVVATEDEDYQ